MGPLETRSYRFDRFTLDLRAGCMRLGEAEVPLRPKSFEVLLYLVRNPGRLVSKGELIERVWPGIAVTENSLAQCIKDVREALGDREQAIVQTVAKRGYRFRPAVSEMDTAPAEAGPTEPSPTILAAAAQAPGPAPPSAERATRGYRRRVAALLAGGMTGVTAIAGGTWLALHRGAGTGTGSPAGQSRQRGRLSVAVLPLEAEAASPGDVLPKGISEDIATALGRFAEIAVASPGLVSRLSSAGASAQDLERQLKVRYLVEGSMRRTADHIRITIRLTDLPRGVMLWSQTLDEPADTILSVEREITARIAGALSVRLTSEEQARAARRSPGSMEAYDFVLRGRELLTRLNRTFHSQAREMFERAIALDPGYSAAYVGLGRVDLSAVALGWTPDPEEALKRAEALARKALALDEANPAAHVLLGRVYTRTQEYDRAVEALTRAVALNPSDPDSYAGLGDALLWRGDPAGAIRALETATAIDPTLSGEDLFSLGAAYFVAGREAEAARVLERVTTRNEGNAFIYAMLAAAYAEGGKEAESRSAAAEVRRLNPFFDREMFGSLFKQPEDRKKVAAALRRSGL